MLELEQIKNIKIEIESKKGKKLTGHVEPEEIIKLQKIHNISAIEETFNMLVSELLRLEENNVTR